MRQATREHERRQVAAGQQAVPWSWALALVAGALVQLGSCTDGKHLPGPANAASGASPSNVPDVEIVLEGKASYYSDSLAGNRTANGERYDPTRLTAASRDLPFGSVVRVIRKDTGVHVLVRINDRGPFGDRRRILDLSRAAARELDMLSRGVIDVRAEVLELGKQRARSRRR